MDNTTFAPVNFDTIEESYICDSGQYEGMTNSDINITSIMENIEGRINFKTVERDKNNEFFTIKTDLLKYLKNDIEDIQILLKNDGTDIIKDPHPGTEGSIKNNKSIKEEEKKETLIGKELIGEFDNFMKYFDLKQKELLKIEKKFFEEIKKNKEDVKQMNQLIEYFVILKDKYDDSEENKKTHEDMLKFANNILKNSKVNSVKEEFIIRKREMMQYLDIIKYLNKANVGNTCSLCLINNVNFYFNPCGHTCCEECLNRMGSELRLQDNQCVFCRKNIYETKKLYYI